MSIAEELTKSVQTADLLDQDVMAAWRAGIDQEQDALVLLLHDLLPQIREMRTRLAQIRACVK